jgi:hypothetical protein
MLRPVCAPLSDEQHGLLSKRTVKSDMNVWSIHDHRYLVRKTAATLGWGTPLLRTV